MKGARGTSRTIVRCRSRNHCLRRLLQPRFRVDSSTQPDELLGEPPRAGYVPWAESRINGRPFEIRIVVADGLREFAANRTDDFDLLNRQVLRAAVEVLYATIGLRGVLCLPREARVVPLPVLVGQADHPIGLALEPDKGAEPLGHAFGVVGQVFIVDDFSRMCVGQLVDLSISGARMVRLRC